MKAEPVKYAIRICHPDEDSDNVKTDAEFENLIPPLSPSELAELHRSLDTEGCRDALIIWKDLNKVVDGHNRLRYCRAKKYPFPVVEREFANKDEVKEYIIKEQLGRRNLSPAAESYLRGKRYLEERQQGARSDLTSGQSDQKTSAEKLGEEFKVGEKTIRRDGKFSEAVDAIIENCGSEARNVILSRETGLTRGGILRLAKLKPAEQKQFLKELQESGKRPRKPRRNKRRTTLTVPSQPKALAQALLKKLAAEEVAEVARALTEAMQQGSAEEEVKGSQKGSRAKGRAKPDK